MSEKLRKAITELPNDKLKDVIIIIFEHLENIANEITGIWDYLQD